MKQSAFVGSQAVQSFTKWIATRLDQPGSFNHSYILLKNTKGDLWKCNSIFNAFENYKWHFSYTHPEGNKCIQGDTFQESKKELESLSEGLRKSTQKNDHKLCQAYCIAILEWGGVSRHNSKTVENYGTGIVAYLNYVSDVFNSKDISTKTYHKQIKINSGFSKIYSSLIDDFIIYDSRVGAALGLLIRKHCEETNQSFIPTELSFAYGGANSDSIKRRNPSSGNFIFSKLSANIHISNNIRANWLLKYILENSDSQFNKLESKEQLRALEAALFMIGYSVL